MHGKVKLWWVPRLVGITGNKIADEMARKGEEKVPVGSKPIIGSIQKDITIKGNVFQEHACR